MLQEKTRVRFIPDERRDHPDLHPIPAHTGTVLQRTTDGFYRMDWDNPNPVPNYFNLETVFTEERLEQLVTIDDVTVIYPVTLVNIEVPAKASVDERREIIYNLARMHDPEASLIHDCSDDELIE